MPRQATCLVLGRSAEAGLTSRTRPFTTGSRLCANDDSGNSKPPPSRSERAAAAASALGAIGRTQDRSSLPYRAGNLNRPGAVQPPARLGGAPRLVRPPANLVSRSTDMLSVRFGKREESAPGSPSQAGRNTFEPRFGGARTPSRFPEGERPGGAGRFEGRSGGFQRGGFQRGGFQRGGFQRGGFQRGGFQRGGFQRGGFQRGGFQRGGFRRGGRDGGRGRGNRDQEDEDTPPEGWCEETKAYMREAELGTEVPYNPSFTPSLLLGWGPAVATNTATGLNEIALRNIRVLAGGRPHSDGEPTFERIDMKRWLAGGKPIYFSSSKQKEGMITMLEGSGKALAPLSDTKIFKRLVARLRKEHGEDYGAFVKAVQALDPAVLRQKVEAARQAKIQRALTTRSGTVKEAISKYALKGEHLPVQYAEDTYGKLAMYHALGSTYRPTDGSKFDAKVKTLVAS